MSSEYNWNHNIESTNYELGITNEMSSEENK